MKKELEQGDVVIISDLEAGMKYGGVESKNGRPWVIIEIEEEHYKLVSLTSKQAESYTGHSHNILSNGSYIRTDSIIIKKPKQFVEYSKQIESVNQNDMETIFETIEEYSEKISIH